MVGLNFDFFLSNKDYPFNDSRWIFKDIIYKDLFSCRIREFPKLASTILEIGSNWKVWIWITTFVTKLISNRGFRRCSSGIIVLFIMPNLHHCRKLLKIRCHEGAGTKMHKYLVGFIKYPHLTHVFRLHNINKFKWLFCT